jgi:Tfp pilus assembly protein PilF
MGITWKKFGIGLGVFLLLFTLGYGIWRAAGGSFKPKPEGNCVAGSAARNEVENAVSAKPDDFATQIKYAAFVYDCKDFSSAINGYSKAAQLAEKTGSTVSKDDRVKSHFGLGLSYFYNQDTKNAQAQFKLVTTEQPNNALAFFTYGSALQQDNPTQAIEMWQKAIQLDPGSNIAQQAQQSIDQLKKK